MVLIGTRLQRDGQMQRKPHRVAQIGMGFRVHKWVRPTIHRTSSQSEVTKVPPRSPQKLLKNEKASFFNSHFGTLLSIVYMVRPSEGHGHGNLIERLLGTHSHILIAIKCR